MSPHLGAYIVDAVIWLFIFWAVVIAFISRKAAVERRYLVKVPAPSVTPTVRDRQHVVIVAAQQQQPQRFVSELTDVEWGHQVDSLLADVPEQRRPA